MVQLAMIALLATGVSVSAETLEDAARTVSVASCAGTSLLCAIAANEMRKYTHGYIQAAVPPTLPL